MIYPAVYDELIDFVAAHAAPAKLVTFHSGDEAQERCSDLLFCEKNDGLSSDGTKEPDSFLSLGDAMLWVKARARRWAGERQRCSKGVAMLPRLMSLSTSSPTMPRRRSWSHSNQATKRGSDVRICFFARSTRGCHPMRRRNSTPSGVLVT